MIEETNRLKLYDQVERQYPLRSPGSQPKQIDALLPKQEIVDLSVQWQREVFALKEQLLAGILFQLHTMFEFPAEDAEVKRQTREALQKLFELEQTCRSNGDCDVYGYVYHLFRKQWHSASVDHSPLESIQQEEGVSAGFRNTSGVPAPPLLATLQHLEHAGFFQKSRQEIAGWTKRFLLIERYHRLDAIEHENRLDHYRLLRSQILNSKEPLRNLEDLNIWLEFRMIEESGLSNDDAGPLSHRFSQELESHLGPELLEGAALQPALYVLLKCHQYCLAETLNVPEQRRMEKLSATRQLDSLLDLMRIVVNRTIGEQSIPEAGALLDRLQSEGFNIEHQGFRDPYEASLVALEEVERIEKTRLPLFMPLKTLSGEFEHDLTFSREILIDWHNRIIRDIASECEAYQQAFDQPLPQNHLIGRLVRFATGWTIAAQSWLPQKQPEKLEEKVRESLPENVIRQLVRPRKGYELKSRNDLKQLIQQEVQTQWDALQRIAHSRRIQGYHDYIQFTRYVAFQYLRSESGSDQPSRLPQAALSMTALAAPEWVAEVSRKWGLKIKQIHPHALESVEHYCRSIIPSRGILPLLQQNFETTESDLQEVYDSAIAEFSSVFYTLLVGYGRHREELPRIKASQDFLVKMIHLLAPPLETIHTATLRSLKEQLSKSGESLYRGSVKPYLLNASEWKAYLAWQIHQLVGDDVQGFLDDGDLDALLMELENTAAEIDLPPQTLTHQTVQSTMIGLLKPEEKSSAIPEDLVREIVQMLPQIDCAACGQASCSQFARSLLTGRAQPQNCVQLPKHALAPLLTRLQQLKQVAGNSHQPTNMLEALSNHNAWRSFSDKQLFHKIVYARAQKARRLLMNRLQETWENLSNKPQIFKCPDLDEFHTNLRAYMGHEAVERLHEEERIYLTEHGDERLKADWFALKERQNWLNLANRRRQSRPLLQRKDPSWTAAGVYENIFFLHQLSSRDRTLVLQHRLEKHQDGFSQWWNEDLLAMNLPDFFIRDWEDFSKIIKNAYWHQESSLSAEQILSTLKNEVLLEESAARIQEALLAYWLDSESAAAEKRELTLKKFRQRQNNNAISNVEELRELIGALVDESKVAGAAGKELSMAILSLPISAEEQLILAGDKIWKKFQDENYQFSINFSCFLDQLLPAEKEALQSLQGSDGMNPSSSAAGSSGHYLVDWQEPVQKRVALIRALIVASIKERYLEEREYRWSEQNQLEIPSAFFNLLIRRSLREGIAREQIEKDLHGLLQANSNLRDRLLENALNRVILKCQYESLHRANQLPLFSKDPPAGLRINSGVALESFSKSGQQLALQEKDALLKALPELKAIIDLLLERHKTMDRERLLRYLFLLAKMEGNLDSLTALLREIRETSDIMEAAWLRFTEERITEGPGQKSLPGTSLGIPLLASRMKDKDPLNRGLRDGISRKEKKNIAAAVNELTNFIRFHVLLNMEQNGTLQSCIADFQNAGYDLSGIEKETLDLAIQQQWDRRQQLPAQKIWIYTTVTARRLAAQDSELQEAEREFYAIRSEILKGAASSRDHYHEIASRRGVALGRIKEEMYRQLSDLLEEERIATFQKRIEQIVDQLDQKREEIYHGWSTGRINRRTVFYTLRQYQKRDADPSWNDFQCFLRDHWFAPLEDHRSSQRQDRNERIQELDDLFQALLGVSLLELEAEAERAAEQDLANWMATQAANLESRLI